MQNSQSVVFASELNSGEAFSVRQRLLSASLSLAMTGSATVTCAMANTAMPTFVPVHTPLTPSHMTHTTPVHTALTATHNAATSSIQNAATSGWRHVVVPTSNLAKAVVQTAANLAVGADDLNLASATPLFAAGGLAGFHTITLDIGGKQEQFSVDSKLTGAELVAAQQVLSGGKQQITINSQGVATGGTFSLNSSTVSALDTAIGGNLNSLVISHGVKAVDSLSTLDLSGSLVDMGSIVVGAAPGAKGQTVDTIAAANIYNGSGATISSAVPSNTISSAGLTLSATGMIYNSGTVSSSSVLNISAPTINNVTDGTASAGAQARPVISAAQNVNLNTQSLNNAGLIASTAGNVNIVNGGGNNSINVVGTGGTIQAEKGNINFNDGSYNGSGNITVSGGNYLSKEVNFNAGTGAIEADVDEVTGVVNGTASSSHIVAATNDLDLGNIAVSGDPTYYNTAGNITISGDLVGNPDLAIIASGDVIGAGGKIDTSAATVGGSNGGDILIVAGANFTVPTGAPSTNPSGGDLSNPIMVTNSTNSGGGSKTGGYIDLSGQIYTENPKGVPVATISSAALAGSNGNGGDITMVAYKGSAAFSGGIIATSDTSAGAAELNASGAGTGTSGNVTLIGSSLFIYAQSISGNNVTVLSGNPVITSGGNPGGTITVTNGAAAGGAYQTVAPGSQTNTEIFLGNILATDSLNISSGGLVYLPGTIHATTSATITSTNNIVEGVSLSTGGAGGVSGGSVTAENGANGGPITVTGEGILFKFIDSSGGGGAGGSTTATGATAGGQGGDAGTVTLNATDGSIEIQEWINASGGGGGGGGGAPVGQLVGGAGGAAGKAGNVIINAPKGSYISTTTVGYSILDFDGAAGGAGGASSTGIVAGGGGGGGTAFGGGGGGGAAGIGTGGAVGGGGAGVYFLGAGGGGAGTTSASTSATGGGGGTSSGTLGTIATGGLGGVSTGATGVNGTNGGGFTGSSADSAGGNGGRYSSMSSLGGAGGAEDGPGSGGANGAASGNGFGSGGGNTTLAGGQSNVTLTVGAKTGLATDPIGIDTPNLYLIGKTAAASIYASCGGDNMTLQSVTMIAGSTLEVSDGHNVLTIAGPVIGPSIVDLQGAGGVDVNVSLVASKSISITGGQPEITQNGTVLQSAIGGNVVVASGKDLTAPTVNLGALEVSSFGGNVTATVNSSNISVIASVGANLTVDTTGLKGTTILSSLLGTTGTFSLNVNATNGNPISVKDTTTTNMAFSGTGMPDASITLTSTAKSLTVNNVDFTTVSVADTYKAATGTAAGSVVLANIAGSTVGNGSGPVSISTVSDNIVNGAAGSGVEGTSVSLSSAAGSIGVPATVVAGVTVAAIPVNVATPILTVSAAKGSVNVADSVATVLNAGTALSGYDVSGAGLTVNGAVSGGTVALTSSAGVALNANVGTSKSTSVSISAADGITQNSKAVISGENVSLTDTTSGEIGTFSQPIATKATVTLVANANYANADVYINQTGAVAFATGTSPSIGGTGSSLQINSTGTLKFDGDVSFSNIIATAPTVEVASSAQLTVDNLFVIAPTVLFDSGSTTTISQATTISAAGALNVSGAGTVNLGSSLSLGGYNQQVTKSVTLGTGSAGINNPFAAELGNATLETFDVKTTGNFSSVLGATATSPTIAVGGGGNITITAGNIIAVGDTGLNAIAISTFDPTAGGGTVNLTLTGTQAVVLGNAVAMPKAPIQFNIDVSGGTVPVPLAAGSIDVSSNGLLTVNSVGIAGSNNSGSLSFSGAKGLVVADILNGGQSILAHVSLNSGDAKPFTIGLGASQTTNGTVGAITTDNLALSNNSGNLVVTGAQNVATVEDGGSLTLSAKSGITVGTATVNPLAAALNGSLQSIAVNTGGNFSADLGGSISTQSSGASVFIHAGNVVDLSNSATPSVSPISITANESSAQIEIQLTGTQSVTLGTLISVGKGQSAFNVTVGNSSAVQISAAGALAVDANGITLGTGSNNLLLSGGKSLLVSDPILLNTNLSTVVLDSGSATPFIVGGATVNGTAGIITASNSITIVGLKGITLSSSTGDLNATNINLDTASFLNSGATVTGTSLNFSDSGKNNQGVAATSAGTYSGITSVSFTTNGNVNVGDLLSGTLLPQLNTINISAGGSVTFGTKTDTSVNADLGAAGSITISAGSLLSAIKAPIVFDAPTASSISVTDKAGFSVGSSGTISLASDVNDVSLTSTSGTLTISSPLSASTLLLEGASVAIANTLVSANGGNLTVLASGKTGTITTTGSAAELEVVGPGSLIIGQVSATAPKAAVNTEADTILLGASGFSGALNLNAADTSTVSTTTGVTIASLKYSGTMGTTLGDISVGTGGISVTDTSSLTTSSGATITATGGPISLVVGSTGSALSIGQNNTIVADVGSITLQNLNMGTGTINVGSGADISASGTAKGVGQLNIVIGPVPTTGLDATTAPLGTAPTVNTTEGAGVFYSTNANSGDTITANGSNTLNAFGRNVVFNGDGRSNSITINGGVFTADPPVGMAGPANVTTTSAVSSLASGHTALASDLLSQTNSTLTTSMISASGLSNATSNGVSNTAANLLTAGYTSRDTASTLNLTRDNQNNSSGQQSKLTRDSDGAPSGKKLSGKVSNVDSKTLTRGPLLISPEKNTVVQTEFGSVAVAANSVALIIAFDGGVAVYNMHDTKHDSVVVNASGHRVSVMPGRNAVLTTRDVRYFEQVNPAEFVGYRKMAAKVDADGVRTFESEFDVRTLMRGVEPLRELVRSHDAHSQKVTNSLLKTTAIMMSFGDPTPFEYMAAPRMTAMNSQQAGR